MAFPWLAVGSALGGLWSGSQQRKAVGRAADATVQAGREFRDWLEKRFAPYKERLEGLIGGRLSREAGMAESPALKRQHALSLSDIAGRTERDVGGAKTFWDMRGDVGRSRGEQARARQRGLRARLGERTSYGLATEDWRSDRLSRLLDTVMGTARLATGVAGEAGQGMLGAQKTAATMRGGAASQSWGDIGELFGTLGGRGSGKDIYSQMIGEDYRKRLQGKTSGGYGTPSHTRMFGY